MITAIKALYALLKAAWPTGALLLHPDEHTNWEAALAANALVVRYYQPQLDRQGGMATYRAVVDVCARTADAAARGAQDLLDELKVTSRTPSVGLDPTATPIRETSYERVQVTFTLLVDTQ